MPPEHGLQSENRQHRRTDRAADELFGIAAPAQSEAGEANRAELLERARLLLPGQIVQDRRAEGIEVQLVVLFRDLHQARRFCEGQRPNDDRVHHAEDGGIGADAQGHRQDDSRGE